MSDLEQLISSAQSGDAEAYGQLVRQFQDRAVAYAYSVLRDFHWGQDAAQEAFVEAFRCLPLLQEPLAFPGWLRRIVFKHCDRLTRSKLTGSQHLMMIPSDTALEDGMLQGHSLQGHSLQGHGLQGDSLQEDIVEATNPDCEPQNVLERREVAQQVRMAVAALPEHERSVTLLFYMGQHSHKQIAEYLEVPVTTVKKRLHTARKKLKEKMIDMIQDNLEEQRPSRTPEFAERVKTFTSQFSQMIDEGQSIVRSLAALAAQQQDPNWHRVVAEVQRDITGDGRKGASLSEAMSKHPDTFSAEYISAIRQGEANGNLAIVLQQLSAH
jgi:RNA polymerase sigma factor (sigma-70 family)